MASHFHDGIELDPDKLPVSLAGAAWVICRRSRWTGEATDPPISLSAGYDENWLVFFWVYMTGRFNGMKALSLQTASPVSHLCSCDKSSRWSKVMYQWANEGLPLCSRSGLDGLGGEGLHGGCLVTTKLLKSGRKRTELYFLEKW